MKKFLILFVCVISALYFVWAGVYDTFDFVSYISRAEEIEQITYLILFTYLLPICYYIPKAL